MAVMVTTVSAQSNAASIALTIGQWILKDSKKVYYVRVNANGKDSQSARQNAFQKAIEMAVGSLILSETEVSNGNLTKNHIISYSSGYVEDFKVISESNGNVVMDVWVSESRIANRIEQMGKSFESKVDGSKMISEWQRREVQEQTSNSRKLNGESLMAAVLSDYPRAAYKVTVKETFLKKSGSSPVLSIKLHVEFNDKYADSLADVLMTTRSGRLSDRFEHVDVERGIANFTVGYWQDSYTRNKWIDTFNQPVSIEIDFGDRRFCWDALEHFDGYFFGYDRNTKHYVINSRPTFKKYFELTNFTDSEQVFLNWISSLGKISAKVVDTSSCGK